MIISILASIWCQNLWDELILKNEIRLLEKRYENTPWDLKFIVFTYDIKNPFYIRENILYKEYYPIWMRNVFNIFRNIRNYFSFVNTIKKSDLVVIWWGWIFYDKWAERWWNPLRRWLKRINLIRSYNKKFIFFSVWINIKNNKSYKLIKKIFSWSSEVVVRDIHSQYLLDKLWIKSKRSLDPVFCDSKLKKDLSRVSHFITAIKWTYLLKKLKSQDLNLDFLKWLNLEWKRIGIAFRAWYIKNEKKVLSDIIKFLLENNASVLLMPHSFHKIDKFSNDFHFLESFANEFDIKITKSLEETYRVYKDEEIDLCLAMRLHSMILSQVYEIPFIWVSYSKKTDEILEQLSS